MFLYYDYKDKHLIHIYFSSYGKESIYESLSNTYEERIEVDEDLMKHRPFYRLSKDYEKMWDTKTYEYCIKKYHDLQNKINKNYQKPA